MMYNKKEFLVPDSIKTCSSYHAKILPDGTYMFRIHDCRDAVRLIGNVSDPVDVEEAVRKLRCLANAAGEFADFIEHNYKQEV